MKYLFVLLFVACSLQCLAQDPVLYEHTWYLNDLIIEGDSNPPPFNSDIGFVILIFDEGLPNDLNFQTLVCQEGISEVEFDDPNSSFSFVQTFSIGGIECEMQGNTDYEALYFNFFLDDISFPFVYEITSDNGNLLLGVTSESGDLALYSNEILTVSDPKLIEVRISPNPMHDVLSISSLNNEIFSIQVYDIQGKQVTSFEDLHLSTIEISLANIVSGMYFLKIQTHEGQITKRVVKK
jgi:hypothetical protein